MKQSEFGKINLVNLLNSLYHAIVAGIFPLIGYVSLGRMPSHDEFCVLLGAILSAFFGSLFKGGATNSKGELFKKEVK